MKKPLWFGKVKDRSEGKSKMGKKLCKWDRQKKTIHEKVFEKGGGNGEKNGHEKKAAAGNRGRNVTP